MLMPQEQTRIAVMARRLGQRLGMAAYLACLACIIGCCMEKPVHERPFDPGDLSWWGLPPLTSIQGLVKESRCIQDATVYRRFSSPGNLEQIRKERDDA